ncbi:MAG: hypothetical protein OYK82_01615 [Gammaproteobacteria bacterium]|nr:hypothetical protein [Gammaproteobacteria bacterium]MDE0248307.1 hypothetical protein [Gammaproteobacteria bacterium]MDE0393453.1 hypothetical protein [Gammaproteobacteria bacterium]
MQEPEPRGEASGAHGPDNFIEPARFDGVQPTFFLEVPPGWHGHYCIFTI